MSGPENSVHKPGGRFPKIDNAPLQKLQPTKIPHAQRVIKHVRTISHLPLGPSPQIQPTITHLQLLSVAEMKLEATLATWEAPRRSTAKLPSEPTLLLLLEKLGKRMLTVLERISTLLGHGIHGILAVVKALPQLGVGKDLVRLIEQRHLGFGAAFVWMCALGGFTAVDDGESFRFQ